MIRTIFSTSVELDSQNWSVCSFRLSPILYQMSQKLPCILIRARGRFLRSRIFDLSFPEPVMGITRITHSRRVEVASYVILCYLNSYVMTSNVINR